MLNWKISYWLENTSWKLFARRLHAKRSVKVLKCGPTLPEKFPQAIEMPVKEKIGRPCKKYLSPKMRTNCLPKMVVELVD